MVEEVEGEKTSQETPPIDVEVLQKQLVSLQTELDQTKKGLSTAHQTLTAKDKELKRQTDIESKINGIEDRLELLATAFVTKSNPDDIGVEQARPDVVKMLRQQREEQETKRKQQELLATQQEYAQKADALYNRAKVIFADDDEAIERVEDLLTSGRLERAEVRVTKAEQSKETPKSKETDDQRVERLAQEKFQKLLEEKGLLKTYTTTPSGGSKSLTREDVSKMSPSERRERASEIASIPFG